MLKKNILAIILLTSLAPALLAENGASAEILFGSAVHDLSGLNHDIFEDDIYFGFRGVIPLTQHLATEVAYHNYGEASETEDYQYFDYDGSLYTSKLIKKTSSIAFTAGLKGTIPIYSGFSFTGSLGISFWSMQYESSNVNNPYQVLKSTDDGTDLYYGIGLQYELNTKSYIGLEYKETSMNPVIFDIPAKLKVDTLHLSLGARF